MGDGVGWSDSQVLKKFLYLSFSVWESPQCMPGWDKKFKSGLWKGLISFQVYHSCGLMEIYLRGQMEKGKFWDGPSKRGWEIFWWMNTKDGEKKQNCSCFRVKFFWIGILSSPGNSEINCMGSVF